MQFNEKLKELRAKKGVSQSELAESIYVSRSAVAKWENGLGLPSNESLRLLSEYFEVSKEELYSDAPTEKVIVQKNQIISRSRKLLIIISTVCAVAITAIIVLAVVLGLKFSSSSFGATPDNPYFPNIGVTGALYKGAQYDYDNNCWAVPYSQWELIEGKSEYCPPGEIPQVLYNLTVGEEYVLSAKPYPSGYNGHAFGLIADRVGVKYDSDLFEVFRGIPELTSGPSIDFVFKIKKPCSLELIMLYLGKEVTEKTEPDFLFIINAELPTEETA